MERRFISLLGMSFIWSGLVPALSSAAYLSGTAYSLSDVRHARLNPMPYCGGIHIWHRFFGVAQEKDFGVHGDVACHCSNGLGRSQRTVSFLVLLPATQATKYLGVPVLQHFIARLPWLLQFFLAVVVADMAEYLIHFALHKVPFPWRFHAIHHSSKALDWAGSRSHFVDDTLVRAFILVPLMFGFSRSIIFVYLIFVTLHGDLDALQFRSESEVARRISRHA